MHLWHTRYDPKIRGLHHQAARGFGHALLTLVVSRIFKILRVSAAIHEQKDNWVLLNDERNFQPFEIEHGADKYRYAYNDKNLGLARRSRKIVRGEHRGHSDIFAPIVARGKFVGTLVVGPFSTAEPSASALLRDWRALSGRTGRLTDPGFASFLSASLSLLVLPGERAQRFEELLGCLTRLMAGEGHADQLVNRAEELRAELEQARFAERTWEQVRTLLDEHFVRISEMGRSNDLRDLGLSRAPDHLLVGLGSESSSDLDPVEALIRCNALQRAAVDWARAAGNAVAGQVGDRGVVILSGADGSPSSKRRRAVALCQNLARMASERFGLSLHFGLIAIESSAPLGVSYQAALAASEGALRSGESLVLTTPSSKQARVSLRRLRLELSQVADEDPSVQRTRFERYLEAVATHCHFRVEPALGHLEAGFERFAEPLISRGALDERGFQNACERLERSAGAARSWSELVATYRGVVAELCGATTSPVQARRDRSLRGAIDYMRKHYREPISREQIARIAGFAPAYFSVLFQKSERMTFERYLLGLRTEYAKQLLEDTRWSAARVAELCGFNSPQYFSTAFRRETGHSPSTYRLKTQSGRAVESNLIKSRNDSKQKAKPRRRR